MDPASIVTLVGFSVKTALAFLDILKKMNEAPGQLRVRVQVLYARYEDFEFAKSIFFNVRQGLESPNSEKFRAYLAWIDRVLVATHNDLERISKCLNNYHDQLNVMNPAKQLQWVMQKGKLLENETEYVVYSQERFFAALDMLTNLSIQMVGGNSPTTITLPAHCQRVTAHRIEMPIALTQATTPLAHSSLRITTSTIASSESSESAPTASANSSSSHDVLGIVQTGINAFEAGTGAVQVFADIDQ